MAVQLNPLEEAEFLERATVVDREPTLGLRAAAVRAPREEMLVAPLLGRAALVHQPLSRALASLLLAVVEARAAAPHTPTEDRGAEEQETHRVQTAARVRPTPEAVAAVVREAVARALVAREALVL